MENDTITPQGSPTPTQTQPSLTPTPTPAQDSLTPTPTPAQDSPKEDKKAALHYMETLVDVARESFLILDADLRVISANGIFLQTFKVTLEETINKLLYDLGNGQWDIPELRILLEEILPEKKTVRDYSVTHVFETIGKKTILLNARRIDTSQLIILAMEDITPRMDLEDKLAKYTKGLEVKGAEQTLDLAERVKELEALNKTMVGRELKMVELKKEIAALKGESRSSIEREELKKKPSSI